MAQVAQAEQRRTVDVGRTSLVAAVTAVLGLAINSVLTFVSSLSSQLTWLLVPVVTVLLAVVEALVKTKVETVYPEGGAAPGPGVPHRRRGLPFTVSVLLTVGVVAVLAVAATFGVRYAVGWFSGNEPGVDRLEQPVTVTDSGLAMTVEKVEQTRHFTRVTVLVRSGLGISLDLPVHQNATLVSGRGDVLQADGFRSDWATSVGPGSTQRGVVTFVGHFADEVRLARLTFSTVFRQGFEGPTSIAVPDLRLRPP